MLGDFILFSPCLKIIKENIKNAHVTLICSEFNYQIAKNYEYVDKFIILKKNFIGLLLKNFKYFFLTKYEYLFQFDGKNRSYLISYFIKSKIKSTICFVKYKKIFKINYKVTRPPLLLLKLFFNTFVFCNERYSAAENAVSPIHYQANYFNILEKLDFKITSKKNIFSLDKNFENIFKNFYKKYINRNYCIFHFDEKWDKYGKEDLNNCLKIINILSSKMKVLITTGIKPFKYLNNLESLFSSFNYKNKNFIIKKNKETGDVIILKNMPLDLLAFFIRNSVKNISNHSGPILHISAAFDINVVDIIKQSKFNELARWIPFGAKYKRYSFENLKENLDKI